MILNDPLSDRKAEAGAAFLGGIKGFEDMLQLLLCHAAAGIFDSNCQPPSSLWVDIRNSPPFGIASIAFRKRFKNACWS